MENSGGGEGLNELEELLRLLEERLVQHDESRKKAQKESQDVCAKIMREADLLEEKLIEEIQKYFEDKEEHILSIIVRLKEEEDEREEERNKLIEEAQKEVSDVQRYEIERIKEATDFVHSYAFKVVPVKMKAKAKKKESTLNGKNESIVDKLQGHLDKINASISAAQERVVEISTKRRKKAERLEKRVAERLESLFTQEDARIQSVVSVIRSGFGNVTPDELEGLKAKAKLALAISQSYSFGKPPNEHPLSDNYDLAVTINASLEYIDFELRKASDVNMSFMDNGMFSLSFAFFDDDEMDLMKRIGQPFNVEAKMWMKGANEKNDETTLTFTMDYILEDGNKVCSIGAFSPSTAYFVKMRVKHSELCTQWSEEIEFTTPEFNKLCAWKKCPDDIKEGRKYTVDEKNPRIATKNIYGNYGTIIGNTLIPSGTVTSWAIKILWSKNSGGCVFIGVAPSSINLDNGYNYKALGWYFDCYASSLYSGPPHNYRKKEYGPRKGDGQYVHTGDSMGVVMDTSKGELSFILNNVNLGVAYEGIPLDKPLVPCVILYYNSDSIELDLK